MLTVEAVLREPQTNYSFNRMLRAKLAEFLTLADMKVPPGAWNQHLKHHLKKVREHDLPIQTSPGWLCLDIFQYFLFSIFMALILLSMLRFFSFLSCFFRVSYWLPSFLSLSFSPLFLFHSFFHFAFLYSFYLCITIFFLSVFLNFFYCFPFPTLLLFFALSSLLSEYFSPPFLFQYSFYVNIGDTIFFSLFCFLLLFSLLIPNSLTFCDCFAVVLGIFLYVFICFLFVWFGLVLPCQHLFNSSHDIVVTKSYS